MNNIREELVRLIRLRNAEQPVNSYTAVEQLEERFDDSVPQLIECLSDGHPEIRHLTVQLLAVARPRSDVAVPALVEKMSDEDWLVVTTTIHVLGDFGQLAAAAIPQIEPWLESPNHYLRVLAAITIMKLEPSRTEFRSVIREAMFSNDPAVADVARDFFDGMML